MIEQRLLANRYRILSELGRGGMAVVYRAQDESLGRLVAIKVLHPHLANEQGNRDRFRREAQSIARLKHPNILEVFDYCAESEDRAYIVMECVDGVNLRHWMKEHGPPPPEIASLIVVEVCRALTHAHETGVIHRDIKPENIMVSRGEARVKLMDFGIAHVVDAETLTATGSLLGSPAHMAPEIIDAEESDHRTDIFSLGTVLYWLVSGKLPFDGTSTTRLLKAILMGEYRPLDIATPKAGHQLSVIATTCMQRAPSDRYPTAEALAKELETLIEEGGGTEDETLLAAYLENPEETSKRFEEQLTGRLKERAKHYREQNNIPETVHLLNRLLAYHPNDTQVQNELFNLTRRSSRVHYAIGLLAVIALLGVGGYIMLRPEEPIADHPTQPTQQQREERVTQEAMHLISGAITRTEASMTGVVEARERATYIRDHAKERTKQLAKKNQEEKRIRQFIVLKEKSAKPAPPHLEEEEAEKTEVPVVAPEVVKKTYSYRFRVFPAAANLSIDNRTVTFGEALSGVELEEGIHLIEATSTGCDPFRTRVRVSGPQKGSPIPIVLNWLDGTLQVYSNRGGVVWINDEETPRRFGKNGRESTITVPFGDAKSVRPEKGLKLTLAPSDRLQDRLVRQVTVKPGGTTLVNVAFR